jgi:hypothetical protein
MSHRLGAYTFLPWVRQGIANKITAVDGDPALRMRAAIDVTLRVSGSALAGGTLEHDITQPIELFGPGDIVGINARAIIKTEPRHWITNFETNYLPCIEFYDEDFPWRYTPAAAQAANTSRLRPWIALIVLEEGEFTEGPPVAERPLPYIIAADLGLFPPADELWAWAHVHVNAPLIEDPNRAMVASFQNAAVLQAFEDTLKADPDRAYSRVISPRTLEPNTAYHAFLVPVFETGRLAGLGLDPSAAPHATASAWGGIGAEPSSFPVYHRWYFRTSTVGDFEYLVRLLKPKPMDARVGQRDMDVQHPGSNLPGIADPELAGVLKLGGALQLPQSAMAEDQRTEAAKYENWDEPYPHLFQQRLSELINLADAYAAKTVAQAHAETALSDLDPNDLNPDPLITPPLYGRWHALTRRLLTEVDGAAASHRDNWVHELNLDPRFRVPAGFGTQVIQQNQETYMEAAWQQVGDVLKANQQIKWAQAAREVAWVWYDKHLRPMSVAAPDTFIAVTAPVDRRVQVADQTRYFSHRASVVPRVAVSAPMRRVMRPRARLVRRLGFPKDRPATRLISRLNEGAVHAAPPKITPPDLATTDRLADALVPTGIGGEIVRAWERLPASTWAALAVIAVLLLVLMLGWVGALVVTVAVGALTPWGLRQRRQQTAADSFREERQTPDRIDALPKSPDFRLSGPGAAFAPSQGTTDSVTAQRYKAALKDVGVMINATRRASERPQTVKWNMAQVVDATLGALDVSIGIPKRTAARVRVPARIREAMVDRFVEAMAYPEFGTPMYKPLVGLSDELFLPNLQYISENTISLLETNQRFIESYMIGLNHEFARELLWREYPTDQRGSYFRQFWDVSSYLARASEGDVTALTEKLRDIPPLHRWVPASKLGDHDNRGQPGDNESELVLVIRGELLKKYPTAVIYANRARWQTTNGRIDKGKARALVEPGPAEEDDPPDSIIRTPLYEAKVDPDIYFFGFDLTAEEAEGTPEADPGDPGWFFVIEERPGEPRFGLDVESGGAAGGVKHHWNDVAWSDVTVGAPPGSFLSTTAPGIVLISPPGTDLDPVVQQHNEDRQILWDANVSAAELAYILYQVPVRIAVHAAQMLPKTTPTV